MPDRPGCSATSLLADRGPECAPARDRRQPADTAVPAPAPRRTRVAAARRAPPDLPAPGAAATPATSLAAASPRPVDEQKLPSYSSTTHWVTTEHLTDHAHYYYHPDARTR